MFLALLAAFGTATSWATSSILSSVAVRHFGAIRFARTRYFFVIIPMLLLTWWVGDFTSMGAQGYLLMAVSGFFGIFLGDTLLFSGVGRLGPRLSHVIFTTAAPMVELLSWAFLGTEFSALKLLGILLITMGVMIAILFGKRQGDVTRFENLHGPLWLGVAIMLAAAAFQAIGTVIAKPVLDAGADPLTASTWRVLIALVFYALLLLAPRAWTRGGDHGPYTTNMTLIAFASGMAGMAIGITLFLYALKIGDPGVVSAVAGASPLVQLPLLWIITRQAPALGAWAGSGLAVMGVALISIAI